MNMVCDNTTENCNQIWKFSMLRTTNYQYENYRYLTLLSVSFKNILLSIYTFFDTQGHENIDQQITVQGKCGGKIEDPSFCYIFHFSLRTKHSHLSVSFSSEMEYLTEVPLLVLIKYCIEKKCSVLEL